MTETFIQFLHIVPLAMIIMLSGTTIAINHFAAKKINTTFLIPTVLILCSIGILAGNKLHHGELLNIIDPCFGYAATLIAVASKLVSSKANDSIKSTQ